MFDLTGMTALVTGASGGIGSAIAIALSGRGARLAVSGSNADKLESYVETANLMYVLGENLYGVSTYLEDAKNGAKQ